MAATQAFIETAFQSGAGNAAKFESFESRSLRYDMYWSYYTGHQYDATRSWFAGKRVQKGLYRYVRNIYNPVERLGDFWTQAIWRGQLDPDAGDKGAIPVKIGDKADDETLRPLIAQVNAWSNWSVNMVIHVLHGSILGDAVIYVRDDPARQQTRLEVLHPGELIHATVDDMGFVKFYVIEYSRIDNDGKAAIYREECRRGEGEQVVFTTFRGKTPYAWAGNPGETWALEWGFIPLVLTQHKNVGLDYGYCEFHAQVGKIDEANDEASLLNDQLRKSINAKWWVNGKKPSSTITVPTQTPSSDNPQPERENEPMIYSGDAETTIVPMVAPVDIPGALANLDKMLEEIENDLPELKAESWDGGAGPSDETIAQARGRVEDKVKLRRPGYDSGYVRAAQMAITIAAMSGYEGFNTYNRESYKSGALDFSVSPRPVFPPQPGQVIEAEQVFWTGWKELESIGSEVPFEAYALSMGRSQEWIDGYIEMRDKKKMTRKTEAVL